MSLQNTIARPYAKAVFAVAQHSQQSELWSNMLAAASQIALSSKIQTHVTSMLPSKAVEVFMSLGEGVFVPQMQNLLEIMAENHRLSVLPAVERLFTELVAESAKQSSVELRSASALSEQQCLQIQAALEKRLGHQVALQLVEDPQLLAGIVIKSGDLLIDGSVRGQLERLSEKLQA